MRQKGISMQSIFETLSAADGAGQRESKQSLRKLTGRCAMASDFFHTLYRQLKAPPEKYIFCTDDGLILAADQVPAGCSISDVLPALPEKHPSCAVLSIDNFLLITEEKDRKSAEILQQTMKALLFAADENEKESRYLLDCLNSVNNSISIYDANAVLLFANNSFCKDLSLSSPQTAVGLPIEEILKRSDIKIQSLADNSTALKMMDVLSTGKPAIDWEVRIESENTGEQKLVSNDMYPVKDSDEKVIGLVELTHSRQQDIKRTRKIMGLAAEYTFSDIVGESRIIKDRIKTAKEYAGSPYNFLITGESGVGKELFAQSIHNYSPRHKGPFVALNCANFSDGLIESELFGYVGGAFTGASKNGQIGKFELADDGTLFLDEIGELPLHFQSKLLRVLETWTITRIGSSKPIPVNVRLIAATNRNLAEMVEEGLFRQDLYYRLQVLTIEIPPLRHRREDLLPLASFFLEQAAAPYMDTPKILDADAKDLLISYDWKGNVRELRNVINRAAILSKSKIITAETLGEAISSKNFLLKHRPAETAETRLARRMAEIDDAHVNLIQEALDIAGGNKSKAAQLMGISRITLYRMLEKYSL